MNYLRIFYTFLFIFQAIFLSAQINNNDTIIKNKDHSVYNQDIITGEKLNEIIRNTGNNQSIILFGSVIKSEVSIKIDGKKNIKIIGNNTSILNSNNITDVISISNSSNILIEGINAKHDAELFDCLGHVISVNNSDSVIVRNCKLNGSGFIGISINNNSKNILVENCELFENSGNGAAISVDSQNITFKGCSFHDNKMFGILFTGTAKNLSIINCEFYNNISMVKQNE